MASEWFYARDGQKHGPYSSPQLRAMAQSGELLRTDLIWKKGMADWRPAGESTQLFAGVAKPSLPTSPHPTPQPESKTTADAAVPSAAQLKQAARTAVQATQLAAERTKLSTVTIPGAYLQLGKHCYATRAFTSDFAAEFSTLDQLAQRLAVQEADPGAAPPTTFSERAKALAGKGADFAKRQKAALDQALAFTKLGQATFEKHGGAAGASELVTGIRTALDRIAAIDQQLVAYKAGVGAKSFPKKTLLLGSTGAAAALLLAVVGYGLLSDGGYGDGRLPETDRPVRTPGAKATATQTPDIPDVAAVVAGVTADGNRLGREERRPGPVARRDSMTDQGVDAGGTKQTAPAARPQSPAPAVAASIGDEKVPPAHPGPSSTLTAHQRAERDRAYAPPPVPILANPTRTIRFADRVESTGRVTWATDCSLVAVENISGLNGGSETRVFDMRAGDLVFPAMAYRNALSAGLKRSASGSDSMQTLTFSDSLRARAKDWSETEWTALGATAPTRACFAQDDFLISEHTLYHNLAVLVISRAPEWQPVPPSLSAEWAEPLRLAMDQYVKDAGLDKPRTRGRPVSGLAKSHQCIPVDAWVVNPNKPQLVTQFGTTVYEWNLETREGRVLCNDALPASSKRWSGRRAVPPLVFSQDGQQLAAFMEREGRQDSPEAQELIVWETRSGKIVCRMREEKKPGDSWVSQQFLPIAFSPDGKFLVCNKGTIVDVTAGKVLASLDVQTDGGAGWCADNVHVCLMDKFIPEAHAGRFDGDVFLYNSRTGALAMRLRHDVFVKGRPGETVERLGENGEMVMGVSADGTHLGVCSNYGLSIWDIRKDVLSSLNALGKYPKGDGTEGKPWVVSPSDLYEAFTRDDKAATKKYVGKWVAMPDWKLEAREDSPRPGTLLWNLLSRDGIPGIKVYMPVAYQQHRQRFDDPLKPAIIGLVDGVSRDSKGTLLVNVVDCDIIQSSPDVVAAEVVPITPAEPITLEQYKKLKKGLTIADVKKLFGGVGEEKWEELQTRARNAAGLELSYFEHTQRITIIYTGTTPGSQAELVFEGNKPNAHRLVYFTENGLE